MAKHHQDIEKLLFQFEKSLKDNPETMNSFLKEFEQEIKKHFLIEEKAIFIFCKPINKIDPMIQNLLKDHDIILEVLNQTEQDWLFKNEVDLNSLKQLLLQHKNFEDKMFYPKLDQELDDSQKEFIIEKIKETSYIKINQ